MKNTLTFSINVRLKVIRVFYILISIRERVLLKKSWIEENILLLLFTSKERLIFHCKTLTVFNFKVSSSF